MPLSHQTKQLHHHIRSLFVIWQGIKHCNLSTAPQYFLWPIAKENATMLTDLLWSPAKLSTMTSRDVIVMTWHHWHPHMHSTPNPLSDLQPGGNDSRMDMRAAPGLAEMTYGVSSVYESHIDDMVINIGDSATELYLHHTCRDPTRCAQWSATFKLAPSKACEATNVQTWITSKYCTRWNARLWSCLSRLSTTRKHMYYSINLTYDGPCNFGHVVVIVFFLWGSCRWSLGALDPFHRLNPFSCTVPILGHTKNSMLTPLKNCQNTFQEIEASPNGQCWMTLGLQSRILVWTI